MRYLYLFIAAVITYWLAWLADNRPADYYDKCGEGEHIGRLMMKVLTKYNIEY